MLSMLIDAHGHYTTVPAGLRVFRALQISQMGKPVKKAVSISDDEIRASLAKGQLKLMDERRIDMMLLSPMASAMGHHFGGALISRHWTEVNNDLIQRACTLYPSRFAGVCSLPQSPGVSPRECAEELERCVTGLGFVGCNLNPDPSGGYWTDPPLGDEWWYPLYEKLEALDAPAMIHASATCNPAFHTVGSHYLNADSTAFLQLLESRVFRDFPKLRFILAHGGGNIPFQAARYRALGIIHEWEPFDEFIKRFYWDTTVYSQEAMELPPRCLEASTRPIPPPAGRSTTTRTWSMPSPGSPTRTGRRSSRATSEKPIRVSPRLRIRCNLSFTLLGSELLGSCSRSVRRSEFVVPWFVAHDDEHQTSEHRTLEQRTRNRT